MEVFVQTSDFVQSHPPSPSLLGIITLAGNSLQNPDVKEPRGQNPENKGFREATMRVHPTVTASTMIARFY